MYLHIACNKLPLQKTATRRTETLAEKYLLLDSFMFRFNTTPQNESTVLALPESCVDRIITLHHSNVFAGYQSVMKTYLTINEKFSIPNLTYYLRAYIKGCYTCQLHRNENLQPRQLQHVFGSKPKLPH